MLDRLARWRRRSPAGLVTLALVVGLGAGLGAMVFRFQILWVTVARTGYRDHSYAGRPGALRWE